MTQADISKIEENLGRKLPPFYANTMLNYPFPRNSFADEFLLPDDSDTVIDINKNSSSDQSKDKFVVGSDGGEEIYYIKSDNKIYVRNLENSLPEREVIKTNSWDGYLKNIHDMLDEITQDEKEMKERKKNKKWWQFWI